MMANILELFHSRVRAKERDWFLETFKTSNYNLLWMFPYKTILSKFKQIVVPSEKMQFEDSVLQPTRIRV